MCSYRNKILKKSKPENITNPPTYKIQMLGDTLW